MRVGVGVDFQRKQGRAEQGRADHEGQVTGGAHQRSRARQGNLGRAYSSHRAADIAMAAMLSVALFNFSSHAGILYVQQQQQQQQPRTATAPSSWGNLVARHGCYSRAAPLKSFSLQPSANEA
jgi:hypothetical protein